MQLLKANGIVLRKKNQFTGQVNTMHLPLTEREYDEGWKAWRLHGQLIQQAFPTLTPQQREFIKTGITPEQWAKMFPPEQESEA